MIFVISASSSIEIDIRERNSRQKVFSNPWGDPRHQKSKSKISKFQPYRKTQKGSLINIKTTVTVNFREMKNAKTANPPLLISLHTTVFDVLYAHGYLCNLI